MLDLIDRVISDLLDQIYLRLSYPAEFALGGLLITLLPLDPSFADSNPAEDDKNT